MWTRTYRVDLESQPRSARIGVHLSHREDRPVVKTFSHLPLHGCGVTQQASPGTATAWRRPTSCLVQWPDSTPVPAAHPHISRSAELPRSLECAMLLASRLSQPTCRSPCLGDDHDVIDTTTCPSCRTLAAVCRHSFSATSPPPPNARLWYCFARRNPRRGGAHRPRPARRGERS